MAAEGGPGLGAAQSGGGPQALSFSFCLFQLSMTCLNLSLLSSSGISCLSRAVSVCMNLLKGVSFLRPADDEDRRFLACAAAPLAVLGVVLTIAELSCVRGRGGTGGGWKREGEASRPQEGSPYTRGQD